jgi:hypothetical protein
MRHAVGKAGYRATEVAAFLIYHFSNVTRTLRKMGGGTLLKSDTHT